MLAGFFKSKFFILYLTVLFVSFIAGYDYAVITSREPSAASSGKAPGIFAQPAAETPARNPETGLQTDTR